MRAEYLFCRKSWYKKAYNYICELIYIITFRYICLYFKINNMLRTLLPFSIIATLLVVSCTKEDDLDRLGSVNAERPAAIGGSYLSGYQGGGVAQFDGEYCIVYDTSNSEIPTNFMGHNVIYDEYRQFYWIPTNGGGSPV
jgi:hypothetical protein